MRQVFSSQRIETVEGVAKLLTDAGIAVHISNGRSYQSKRSGQFSYTEPVKAQLQPAVWVRHAEDQPRARELLRQAGLLETTRPGPVSTAGKSRYRRWWVVPIWRSGATKLASWWMQLPTCVPSLLGKKSQVFGAT